jgi:hypothetical protein
VIEDKAKTRDITLAEVTMNDSQRMLAFNDFFVGSSSHVSARKQKVIVGMSDAELSQLLKWKKPTPAKLKRASGSQE